MHWLFLLLVAFGPTLLFSGLAYVISRSRHQAFRTSRIVSLVYTGLPIVLAIAAVCQNTDTDPDAGFSAFLAAFFMAPLAMASWLVTLVLRPRKYEAESLGMGFSSENS
jgi:hypothetical protein